MYLVFFSETFETFFFFVHFKDFAANCQLSHISSELRAGVSFLLSFLLSFEKSVVNDLRP